MKFVRPHHRFIRFLSAAIFLSLSASHLSAQSRRPPWPEETLIATVDGASRGTYTALKVDDTLCLSLEDTRRIFGGRMAWRRIARKFVYRLEGGEAEFTLDSASAVVAGKTVVLPTEVRAWGNTAYLPLPLFTTPAFGALASSRIQWDAGRRGLKAESLPSISSPEVKIDPQFTRVSLEIGPRVDYRLLSQRDNELTFRFYNGRAAPVEKLSFPEGPIASVALESRSHTTDFTVVLATGGATPQITLSESPRVLTITVAWSGDDSPDRPVETSSPASTDVPAVRPAAQAYLALSPLKTIVIDAGHGGKDAGAQGPGGTLEKDINLRVALDLARRLRAEGRFNVLLTRENDRFLSLGDRSSFANTHKADLFLSLHCNAGLARKSQGFEIYYLSEKATDDEAAAVARRENAVVELEGLSGAAREKLEGLLWSLARNEYINDSSEIAGHISRLAEKRLSLQNRGVKQAGFYVLRGTSMPAVLIEIGFITHPGEEKTLRTTAYHQKLVDTLVAGIREYERQKIQTRLSQGPAGTP